MRLNAMDVEILRGVAKSVALKGRLNGQEGVGWQGGQPCSLDQACANDLN